MSIIYDENSVRTQHGFVPYDRINANAGWLRHQYNLLTLQWISKHTDNFRERIQAEREIKIAQRKIDYHARHPNFRLEAVEAEFKKLRDGFTSERDNTHVRAGHGANPQERTQ